MITLLNGILITPNDDSFFSAEQLKYLAIKFIKLI